VFGLRRADGCRGAFLHRLRDHGRIAQGGEVLDRLLRLTLLALTGLIAVTAVSGGVLIAAGIDKFPPEWLDGTPFGDYLLPGIILFAVGLSSAGAFVAVLARRPFAAVASIVAGIVMVGWIAGEVVLVQQNSAVTSPRSAMEPLYAALGMAVALLGAVSLGSRRAPR
jgi:hypothetical protein